MAPKQVKREGYRTRNNFPFKGNARESKPHESAPTTSKTTHTEHKVVDEESCRKKCFKNIYNKETKSCLGRTCKSWFYIISYSIVYLIFLTTYTMIFLFSTLTALKYLKDYKTVDKVDLLTYSEHGIGLSATPTSENMYPLIWYKTDNEDSYQKYINSIDRLLMRNKNSSGDNSELGPCSQAPYGYGSKPCVIVRINKQFNWAGKPLYQNSSLMQNAPLEVREWSRFSNKMWLHCDGYHSYDKEHIGEIKYYPHPPGFDPNRFPLDVRDKSPLVALQISNFTQGISLSIQCNLWYEHGPSMIDFILYVEPQDNMSSSSNGSLSL